MQREAGALDDFFEQEHPDELMVFIAARPLEADGPPVGYEVRQLDDGLGAMAYTSMAKLVECCGEFQPGAQLTLGTLKQDLASQAIRRDLLDTAVWADWRWTESGVPA